MLEQRFTRETNPERSPRELTCVCKVGDGDAFSSCELGSGFACFLTGRSESKYFSVGVSFAGLEKGAMGDAGGGDVAGVSAAKLSTST